MTDSNPTPNKTRTKTASSQSKQHTRRDSQRSRNTHTHTHTHARTHTLTSYISEAATQKPNPQCNNFRGRTICQVWYREKKNLITPVSNDINGPRLCVPHWDPRFYCSQSSGGGKLLFCAVWGSAPSSKFKPGHSHVKRQELISDQRGRNLKKLALLLIYKKHSGML